MTLYFTIVTLSRNTRPVFIELPVWPTLNFFGESGSCPFNTKKRDKPERLRAEVKENRERIQPIKEEEVIRTYVLCVTIMCYV